MNEDILRAAEQAGEAIEAGAVSASSRYDCLTDTISAAGGSDDPRELRFDDDDRRGG